MIVMTMFPAVASADAAAGSKVFFEEGGEEATYEDWNNRWPMRYDSNDDSSHDWWCRQMHEVHSGQRSIYCARNGYNSHYLDRSGGQPWNVNLTALPESVPQTNYVLRYDTDMDSIMRKEIVGARYYNKVTMTFWFYSDTGVSDAKQPGSGVTVGYDFLNAIYYTGMSDSIVKHVLWTDSFEEATARTWKQVVLDVPNTATWVGFEFVSGTIAPEGGDADNAFAAQGIRVVNGGMKKGVVIDDIKVVGTDPAPDAPLVTSVASLPPYRTNRSFPVSIEDNAPQVGLKYVHLYYRMRGEVNWTKYSTAANPGGTFSVLPITFTAEKDGTYEFFSVGVDQKDVVEERRDSADTSTVVDTEVPASIVLAAGEAVSDGAYNGTAHITINASDALSGVDKVFYRVDGGPWTEYSSGFGLVTEGDHLIEHYAIDLAGNAEEARSYAISIVNGTYRIAFSGGSAFSTGDVTISFYVVTDSAVTSLGYSLDGGPFAYLDPGSRSLSLSGLSDGAHQVTIRALDAGGNVIQGRMDLTVGGAGTGGLIGDLVKQPLLVIIAIVAVAGVGATALFTRRRKG